MCHNICHALLRFLLQEILIWFDQSADLFRCKLNIIRCRKATTSLKKIFADTNLSSNSRDAAHSKSLGPMTIPNKEVDTNNLIISSLALSKRSLPGFFANL